MDVALWVWFAVAAVIATALAVDLFVFHRDAHEVSMREAAITSAVWVTLGLSFGVAVWAMGGGTSAGQYYAGYLIEKALSVENVFVFALILGYFQVPPKYQHRVLFFGVLGALVFRAVFIALGAELLDRFHWTLYIFGAFLVFTGLKMARHAEIKVDPARNPLVRGLRRIMPVSDEYHGQKFLVRRGTKLVATPMLAVLLAIETSDVIFAVDSIPAIFAVTDDTFLVFTSNAFAILGLRALYFLLAGAMHRLAYLKYGLAAVLCFVGVKMLVSEWYKIPIQLSLVVIATILATATIVSLRRAPAGGPTEVVSHPGAPGDQDGRHHDLLAAAADQ